MLTCDCCQKMAKMYTIRISELNTENYPKIPTIQATYIALCPEHTNICLGTLQTQNLVPILKKE